MVKIKKVGEQLYYVIVSSKEEVYDFDPENPFGIDNDFIFVRYGEDKSKKAEQAIQNGDIFNLLSFFKDKSLKRKSKNIRQCIDNHPKYGELIYQELIGWDWDEEAITFDDGSVLDMENIDEGVYIYHCSDSSQLTDWEDEL